MNYRIFRTKQKEYWDIWCEQAIVFPEEKQLEEVFTEENLRKLIVDCCDYSTYVINFVRNDYVDVVIYSECEDGYTEETHLEFVEMFNVLLIS